MQHILISTRHATAVPRPLDGHNRTIKCDLPLEAERKDLKTKDRRPEKRLVRRR